MYKQWLRVVNMDWQRLGKNPFFDPQNKLFIATGAMTLIGVWSLINLILDVIGNPLGTDSTEQEYFLLLSISSLLVTHLLGFILFTRISIDKIVQKKYDDIMNSLVYDDEGKKVYPGDPRENFSHAEWIRLSILQHLDLLEVGSTSEKSKAVQLQHMLQSLDADRDPIAYADTVTMLSKKLTHMGEFEEAENVCRLALETVPPQQKTAFAQIRAALGVVLKKTGQLELALEELTNASEMVSKDDPLRWININKALLRLHLMSTGTVPEEAMLEEIHEELRTLCRSNFGTKNHFDAWRLSVALESYYDLYSTCLASQNQFQWALRYSYAATVLAENRTGEQVSTYSTSHLSRLLMRVGEFDNAMILLDSKLAYLEQRGDKRGWLPYNLARCKYGVGQFEEAIDLYNETIEMKNTDAETRLRAFIGLSHAHNKLGNTQLSESAKRKAEDFAASTGLNPDWEEPITSIEDSVKAPEETWTINQVKMTFFEASRVARAELGIKTTRLPEKGTEYYTKTREIYDAANSA